MTLFARTLITAALALAASAQAAVVTVGSLTRDTTQTTITDTLNNRTWLGWDVTRGLTYAQTLAAIAAGGQFAGYSIARNADAQLFANALLGNNACSTTGNSTCANNLSPTATANIGAITGENYYNYNAQWSYPYDYDYAIFLSDNGTGHETGLMSTFQQYNSNTGWVQKSNEWGTIANADSFGNSAATSGGYSFGWMLYREGTTQNVPEPGTLALTGLALLAATRLRRKA